MQTIRQWKCMTNIFLENLYTKCGGEAISRPFSKNSNLCISLDRLSKVLYVCYCMPSWELTKALKGCEALRWCPTLKSSTLQFLSEKYQSVLTSVFWPFFPETVSYLSFLRVLNGSPLLQTFQIAILFYGDTPPLAI